MGGYGSGRRPTDRKMLTDDLRSIDVRRWSQEGLLNPGQRYDWNWHSSDDGSVNASIGVSIGDQYVTLDYRVRQAGEHWVDVKQVFRLSKTSCNFGGERAWFLCPDCGRRVCLLYIVERFSCRECHDLSYLSQRQLNWERDFERVLDIRSRLNWGGDLVAPFRTKPKGMHWETYFRICEQYDEAVHRAFRGALAKP